jgi:hypothetical protein
MTSLANEMVNEAVGILFTHGFTPTVSNGGKHFKVRWFDHGRRFTLIISRTPSDQRARLRSRTILRRLLRANGTQETL